MTPSHWIPVADQLPESDMPVIVTDTYGVYYGFYDPQISDWVLVFGAIPATGTAITHWLPLPALPGVKKH